MGVPELLAPAGSMQKLKVAFAYGADAVYMAGPKYGLRKSADNFTLESIPLAVEYAKQRSKKVYVTVNAYLHDEDFVGLSTYLKHLKWAGIDAVIVSDLGVFDLAKEVGLNVHVSTQASVSNVYCAQFWKSLGAKRVVWPERFWQKMRCISKIPWVWKWKFLYMGRFVQAIQGSV